MNALEFAALAPRFGLLASDYQKEFTFKRHRYTVAALKPRATKNPVVVHRVGGGEFSMSVDLLLKSFGRKAAAKPPVAAPTSAPSDFAKKATAVGLPADCYGKIVVYRGTDYRITDVAIGRPKRNVTLTRVKDGKSFVGVAADVARLVDQPAPTTPVVPRARVEAATLPKDLFEQFSRIANGLSPENLFADGERTRSEAARQRTRLNRAWKELEAKAGGRVRLEDIETRMIREIR